MEEYKIIQIIPNNKELYAKYKDDECTKGFLTSQIVCFALIECKDGERDVIPMDICGDGCICYPRDASNFVEITEKPII